MTSGRGLMGAEALVPVCCRWSGRPAAGCCRLWAAALGGRAPRCAGRGRWRGLGVWVAVRPPGSLFAPRRGGSPSGLPFKIDKPRYIWGSCRGAPSALCCFGRPASRLLSRFMFIKTGRCACPLYLILRCAQKSTQRDNKFTFSKPHQFLFLTY